MDMEFHIYIHIEEAFFFFTTLDVLQLPRNNPTVAIAAIPRNYKTKPNIVINPSFIPTYAPTAQ